MLQIGPETKNQQERVPTPAGAYRVYRRLLSYALAYKGRLLISIALAIVVAGSFSTMIIGVGTVVQIAWGEEADVFASVESYAERFEGIAWARRIILALPMPLSANETAEPSEATPPPQTESLEPQTQPVHAKLRRLAEAMRANPMAALEVACVVTLGLILIGGIARFFQESLAGSIGVEVSVRLGREMFANIMECSLSFFESTTTGEILSRFTNDMFRVNQGLSNVFSKVIREPIMMLSFVGAALWADWQLTLVGLGVMPLVALIIIRVGQRFRRHTRRSLQKIGSLASMGNEVFGGIAVVKGFRMEDYERGRANGELSNLRHHLLKMVKSNAAVSPLVELVLYLGFVAFVLIMGHRLETGSLDVGSAFMLVGAFGMVLDPVRKLSTVNNMIMASVASAERVFEFIDARPEVVEKTNAADLPPLAQSLRFENVSFAYEPGKPVLEDIGLEIRKGEMVALVGFSGAGKSTVAKLVPRFYDPTAGRVLIDGTDLRDATFDSLRRQIGIVTQDIVLFNETVRNNIGFGEGDRFSLERIREAARAAHADDFIMRLPDGYDTVIGEGGSTLSGGQRQRLAIARAIVKDPAILIMDEATSSLDSESEQAIQSAIDEFVIGRTTIVIAHRLSTVLRAHRIVVLDQGRIAEQGTHAELMRGNGLYRRLYETQFGKQKEEDA